MILGPVPLNWDRSPENVLICASDAGHSIEINNQCSMLTTGTTNNFTVNTTSNTANMTNITKNYAASEGNRSVYLFFNHFEDNFLLYTPSPRDICI